ncbi:hypothetical protein ANN_24975 [Periplaneta americana]|uniref:Uncharacterized protein n=1 Tax=Periplaneta americana TaxID=6978 RepID=A0ABQ8S0F3_PERAM|nr:hypothetical protein ANN_24975 [Periplaneta americana]
MGMKQWIDWVNRVSATEQGKARLSDLLRSGRPHDVVTPEIVGRTDRFIRDDRQVVQTTCCSSRHLCGRGLTQACALVKKSQNLGGLSFLIRPTVQISQS